MSDARRTEIAELTDAPTSATITAAPVTVTTASTEIVAANARRQHIILQNNGTEPCICRLGGTVSTAAYNFTLSKATGARDGLGGTVTIANYQGAINGICESNSTIISIMEIVHE